MRLDISNIRTRWINRAEDTDCALAMRSLLFRLGFSDHKRFPAFVEWDDKTSNTGESHFRLLEQTILKDGNPILILEDDADVELSFNPNLDIPEEADCVYLGTSHGDLRYGAKDIGHGWLQVERVFATHAILHMSKQYAEDMVCIGRKWTEEGKPFDVGLAYELQRKHRVCTPCEPLFFQSETRNKDTRFEDITRLPLVSNG